jgi:hypothetical protein
MKPTIVTSPVKGLGSLGIPPPARPPFPVSVLLRTIVLGVFDLDADRAVRDEAPPLRRVVIADDGGIVWPDALPTMRPCAEQTVKGPLSLSRYGCRGAGSRRRRLQTPVKPARGP